MTILRAERIVELLKPPEEATDPLVITPLPDLLSVAKSGSASIDLRLGTWFATLSQARMPYLKIDSSTSDSTQFIKSEYVKFGREYFLHPGAFVLGITLEWIRLPKNLAAYVIGKSSWGRRGLIIATATSVHPGFKGCLTLEMTNVGQIPIAIKPGMPICQLCFHTTDHSPGESIDSSQFIASRKPMVGKIMLDSIAEGIARLQ